MDLGRMDLGGDDMFHPPVKRSITIAGHQTSITLEPLFWKLLKASAEKRGLPINALVAQIDVQRLDATEPPGLATAIRLWLVHDMLGKSPQAD
ncbi:MAG: ribbon-helix-helix domain-containing protein [Parasphingorhabdus sp.]